MNTVIFIGDIRNDYSILIVVYVIQNDLKWYQYSLDVQETRTVQERII